MIIKKYEYLLNFLNKEIESGTFDVEKNKDYIEKILEIYKESKQKNYSKVKELLNDIEDFSNMFSEKIQIKKNIFSKSPGSKSKLSGSSLEKEEVLGESFSEIQEDIIVFRDWNSDSFDEDNIENFNSVEMITAIFLQNLKEKLGEK